MTDIKFIKEYTNNDKIITDDKLEYLQWTAWHETY